MEFNRINLNLDINMDVNKKGDTLKNVDNNINLEKVYNNNRTIEQKNNEGNAQNEDNGYDERINKLLGKVNEKFKLVNKELSYEVHEQTHRYMVTVKDSETGDIIKEIPSEESLDLFAKMLEMAGLLVDEKS